MRAASRRTRLLAGGGVLVAAAGVAVVIAVSGGDGEDSASAAGSSATATTTIHRQDLVETSSEDGTLGYSDSRNVVNRIGGTVTWLPAVGTVVRTGRRLFEIDGTSVYLLDGGRPAYRDLKPGLTGVDVRQLERNLRALGYDEGRAMIVDGTWDAGTTAAVKRFQSARGMTASGRLALGRVAFQPGNRRVSKLSVALGDSAGGGSGSGSTRLAAYVRAATPEVYSDIPVGTTGPTGPTGPTGAAGPAAGATPSPRAQQPREPAQQQEAQQRTPSARSAAPRASAATTPRAEQSDSGSGQSTVASTLMTTTSTHQIVSVALDTAKESLARSGARVEVELPSGDLAGGRIARVGRVAEQPTGQDGQASGAATIRVVVKLDRDRDRGATLDQAPVSVRLEQRRRNNVLAVPVTALLARSGGTFAVEVVEGTRRRIVAVTTGLYTSGFVEIRGAGLREGMRVADARV